MPWAASTGGLSLLAGAAIGAIGGAVMSKKTQAEKDIAAFYDRLSQGVSREEASQRMTAAELKAESGEEERTNTQVARGGVSGAAGGVSGTALAAHIQSQGAARRAASEGSGAERERIAGQDIQMKIAGTQGKAALSAQERLDKEKAAGMMLSSDMAGDMWDSYGASLTGVG